ncbi:MAG: NlpC/P60 family protein [bacterium]|nr:NlpC/P60 family protein [bacterium]MDD5756539.1 NlpC/P60 family protein [bacterium]
MEYRGIQKILYVIICLCLLPAGNLWATFESNDGLKNFADVLTSRSDIFRLENTGNITLLPAKENLIQNSLNLVNYRTQHLMSAPGKAYPMLSMSAGSSMNIPGKSFSVTGQTKIMKINIYYKVKAGDNLYFIARKFRTSEKRLMKLNRLKSDLIRTGQRLVVGIREKVIEIPYIDENLIKAEIASLKENLISEVESPVETSQAVEQKVVEIALKYLGLPYKYGGETLWGIDCSAFVRRIWGFFGLELPRTSGEQFRVGQKTSKSDLKPGDLVFFHKQGRKSVAHVGIYIGDSKFVHASGIDNKVTIGDLTQDYYRRCYKGARRVINFMFPELMTSTER